MNTDKRIGSISQIAAIIGFTAALAGCGGGGGSDSTAGAAPASAAPAATPPTTAPATTAPVAAAPIATTPVAAAAPAPAPVAPAPVASSKSVTLAWTAPTENTDGSALTNLSGYTIYYGTSATSLTQKISVNSVGVQNYVVENLTAGTWYFEVVSMDAAGGQSGPSTVASAQI